MAVAVAGKETMTYDELQDNFGCKGLPEFYLNWGRERFENATDEYSRDTIWGKVNACWLPETDSFKDLEEELVDSYFNMLIIMWKNPQSQLMFSLLESIAAVLEFCWKVKQMRLELSNVIK